MKTSIKVFLTLVLLTGTVQAGLTEYHDYVSILNEDGEQGKIIDVGLRGASHSWTHSNPYTAAGYNYDADLAAGLIDHVTLTIVAEDVDGEGQLPIYGIYEPAEQVGITFVDRNDDQQFLGFLECVEYSWDLPTSEGELITDKSRLSKTTFLLDTSWLASDSDLVIAMIKDLALVDAVRLEDSTLSVYSRTPNVVPAPGALLLGGLGVGLVGWLRRKHAL